MPLYAERKIIKAILFSILTLGTFLVSCRQDKETSVSLKYDPEKVPSVATDSVTMLISDSGIIRYNVVAKTWDILDKAAEPYYIFPDGVYLEQYDTVFNVVLSVKADTAWYFERKKLWQLKGHVFVRNRVGETFSSEELFWNQLDKKIYSDEYVEINRPEKGILRGTGGFEANEQMTEYKFYKVRKSEIYVKEDDDTDQESENTQEKAE